MLHRIKGKGGKWVCAMMKVHIKWENSRDQIRPSPPPPTPLPLPFGGVATKPAEGGQEPSSLNINAADGPRRARTSRGTVRSVFLPDAAVVDAARCTNPLM